MTAIKVENLCKNYGRHKAVDGISFSINEGEVVGLLGPNGAGKSTTMKILTGFISPSEGGAWINGKNVLEDPIGAQNDIGYLPENAPIYPEMRVKEYLSYIAKIRNLGRNEREHSIKRVAGQCGISARLNQPIGQLSKGYRQRVGLAQALLHESKILILDEPTTGLDPNQIVEIRNLIREIGKKKTVILSTHILPEVQATCDRVIIIHEGNLVADGPVDEVITRSQGGTSFSIILQDFKVTMPSSEIVLKLHKIEGVEHVSTTPSPDGEHHFTLLTRKDIRAKIFEFAVKEGLALLELSPAQSDLEDVFRKLTISKG